MKSDLMLNIVVAQDYQNDELDKALDKEDSIGQHNSSHKAPSCQLNDDSIMKGSQHVLPDHNNDDNEEFDKLNGDLKSLQDKEERAKV